MYRWRNDGMVAGRKRKRAIEAEVAKRLEHIDSALPSGLNGAASWSFKDCPHAATGWQGPTEKDSPLPHQELQGMLPLDQLAEYKAKGYTYRARGNNG